MISDILPVIVSMRYLTNYLNKRNFSDTAV